MDDTGSQHLIVLTRQRGLRLGRSISIGTKRRELVFFDETLIPFCLYERGNKMMTFPEYYTEYINRTPWVLKSPPG